MADSQQLISDAVMDTVERLEDSEFDCVGQFDPLEVYVEAGLDGDLREIYAVMTTGGPHIEVALYSGRVDGYWGGDEHSAPIMDEDTEELLDLIASMYADQWKHSTLA